MTRLTFRGHQLLALTNMSWSVRFLRLALGLRLLLILLLQIRRLLVCRLARSTRFGFLQQWTEILPIPARRSRLLPLHRNKRRDPIPVVLAATGVGIA